MITAAVAIVSTPITSRERASAIPSCSVQVRRSARPSGAARRPPLARTWVIPVAGAVDRYQLYRKNDPDNACDGSASTFMVD